MMNSQKTYYCDLGLMNYREVLNLQHQVVSAKKRGTFNNNIIFSVEHPSVITLGNRGNRKNLIVSDRVLMKQNIRVELSDRGGDITWHGPGQLVVYPVINLKEAKLSVPDYVELLEEIMIKTAVNYGVTASRNTSCRGVFSGNRKLGNVGIAIKRSIAYHGFSLNVNNSLAQFTLINPCGLKSTEMTNLEKESQCELSTETVKSDIKEILSTTFNTDLIDMPASFYALYG